MTEFDFPNPDNPSKVAEKVAQKFHQKGYVLDFSIRSLKKEVDLILKNESYKELEEKATLEAEFTAYVGETICRVFQAQWEGQYFGPLHRSGINYYSCKVVKREFEFWPSHFFGYYFSNGSTRIRPFKDYLENHYYTVGGKEYISDGPLKKLEKLKIIN